MRAIIKEQSVRKERRRRPKFEFKSPRRVNREGGQREVFLE